MPLILSKSIGISPHKPFYDTSFARYFLSGVPLANCYCWGQPIYAPCDGEVIAVVDLYSGTANRSLAIRRSFSQSKMPAPLMNTKTTLAKSLATI